MHYSFRGSAKSALGTNAEAFLDIIGLQRYKLFLCFPNTYAIFSFSGMQKESKKIIQISSTPSLSPKILALRDQSLLCFCWGHKLNEVKTNKYRAKYIIFSYIVFCVMRLKPNSRDLGLNLRKCGGGATTRLGSISWYNTYPVP